MIRKISPSGFGLGRNRDNYDSLRKPFLYRAYVNFINNAAGVLGGNTLNGFAQSSPGDKVFYFENRLLQNSNPHPRNLSVDRVVQTLAELRVLVPVVRWDHLLQHIFPDSRIDSQFRMIVEDIDYFKHLANIRATSTNDVLNTYMVWHLVKKFAPFLGKNMRLLEARFRAELVGGQVQNIDHKAHFSRCLELTNEFFGFGLAHLHRDRFNLGKNIEDAERLFSLIPRIARKHVRNVPWLKDATYKVNDRLESLRVRVAYPGLAATDNTSLIYFKEANTNRDFFDNIIDQMKLKHDWLKMAVSNKHPAKKDHAVELLPWPESLLSLEPHYSYSFNEVTVPLGMLSQPIFSATQNAGLKAATIVVVAQEMLKVIDRFGLQFSENGIVPNSTFDALAERLQCLERQTENELHAYGPMNKFLEEAVPDIAGLRVALQMLDQSASPSKLPGLDYNVRQLFYIGYGQLMCENMTETRASRTNGTLTSAPKRLRLHRTLQQTPDFADAFGCSASSRMVPLEVCDVW
ncbi:endothelin-converting enzyme 1-like [Tropilaelaps mercedesae]|uniref:Endothelin-converting enzyme 1-like n=1 Tax=Tropilaelaps mercedesae TaxID=418985 RepID=A0A1V9X2U3_9ACAR|nr:endothelin-converting enzyme 1-like [Tropilaelaps mercedesae]